VSSTDGRPNTPHDARAHWPAAEGGLEPPVAGTRTLEGRFYHYTKLPHTGVADQPFLVDTRPPRATAR
jgi:hypothetical protein